MSKFLYIEPTTLAPLLIEAKKQPSEETIPDRGTWVIKEYTKCYTCDYDKESGDYIRENAHWNIPCFPEITWGVLKKLKFMGKIK